MGVLVPADTPRLSRFAIVRPAYTTPQATTLEWLARAHTLAEQKGSPEGSSFDPEQFHDRLRRLLGRVACSPQTLGTRGHDVLDCGHQSWNEMSIYDVHRREKGAGTAARNELFARIALAACERLYEHEEDPPRDLVHVTCTGYTSPSAAQRLVVGRGWGRATRVTHAYHMGCYAALPAVRIAAGLVASTRGNSRADIVHTEVCSLHFQPMAHDAEQLVVQSLFADGHVRYSVERGPARTAALAVLVEREEILPDTTESMTWACGDHGMKMTLGRDVPAVIATNARPFVEAMFDEAGLSLHEHGAKTIFAIHPGGPRIIDAVQQTLELQDGQVALSRDILRRFGNMSSATLPHVWRAIVEDDTIPDGTLVATLAFGPGLTVSGALLVREAR